MQEINLKNKIKLIISKQLQNDILYLHKEVKDVEWSGILFYSVVSGSIDKPSELVLKAERVYPMNIGSSAYTEFGYSNCIVDAYSSIDGSEDMKHSLVHSHHSMDCWFSNTDVQELHDNAPNHNYYLSLIVNHKTQYCAKVAMVAEHTIREESLVFKGGSFTFDESKSKVLVTMDCDIELEQDSWFIDRFKAIEESSKASKFNSYINNNFSYNTYDKIGDNSYISNQPTLFDEVITVDENISTSKFLVKWLAKDVNEESDISTILRDMSKKYVGHTREFLLESLEDSFEDYHCRLTGTVAELKPYIRFVQKCIETLDSYTQFDISLELIEMLEGLKEECEAFT